MFAMRPLARQGKQIRAMMRNEPAQMQQRRGMAGGEDDGVHRVNWWDAPQNPDIWQKHHLAWITAGIYGGLGWLLSGGSKDEKAAK
mmetsp:Transcript_15872/g.39539  ORF Transcript_15872/g.39539 Transcript_15872/m.39539 type:complete len:86 (-) Transcript_15872:534-791(-)|eukprot:CAMPEP_0202869148 /NCGR_PEP_ID=MMETSP1391-20130828/11980_1 /ASSEMBLY_ACC=CAM_ASM_000867 /TAXON_ID=1034604 /ORGANISM="Chlamydomonas leiostraca, Strain SAG 11-49" /LENGTH=85 /DNA_ID=CAMNT_0049549413 /DNA_START=26 /DNA_END=283 /DNA_ORIENTATION=+